MARHTSRTWLVRHNRCDAGRRRHIRVPVAVGRLTLLPEAERIAVWTEGVFGGDGSMDRITVMDLR